ncbi:MAG: tetratricopeptide repeat protein [Acidobacteria bacterium]|nr:tetratricopeptide repeat protein [Acidobacteriota bacterium]
MALVESALARPSGERESYLRTACGPDVALYGQVWDHVQWEERMNGFLLDPLFPPLSCEHPFEPGELLDGRFRIVREVAQGGMGIVYEAMDEKLDRRIALKCAKTGFHSRLPPEVRNASAISHPNVCRIFEIHTASTPQGNVDFLTMEFLDGETLAERLARGPVPERDARRLALELCAGLDEAHRNHVIHGDLKSNNVILSRGTDEAVRAVITDFGLARRPGGGQRPVQSGALGGTPDYMAPELLRGEKATVASDIYALGVILSELISGQRPLAGQGTAALRGVWGRVVARCLDPEPSRRFQSAAEIAQALAPRSRRWLMAAIAATLLAVASAAVTYKHATAPRESVSLALMPFEAGPDAAVLWSTIFRETAARFERLQGGKRARLQVIPFAEVARRRVETATAARSVFRATHVARGTLHFGDGNVVLHAFLTDTRTQADIADREFRYAPGELRYAPLALTGMVTSTLRLPPPSVPAVSDAAKHDYTAGLAWTRRNSTIDRALPLLRRAVDIDPDSPLTWAGLAEAEWFRYFITQDRTWLDRASEALRQAQNRDLDVGAVHRVAGLLWANAGFYEQAEAEYSRAIELEPSNSDAYRRLGAVYERNNRLGEALAAFRRAVEQDPTYFKVYQDLGSYYAHRGESREAIAQFEKCVQLAPDEPDAHYALGTAYVDVGRYPEAEHELRAAIALGETPRALNNLAAALMSQGKDQEAVPILVRALERFPDRYLWWMNLGDAYRRARLQADSVRAYRRSLELAEREMARNPRDASVRSRVAYVCARLRDRQRAESEVAQALQLSPKSTESRIMAVWTYEALGRRQDTLAILKDSSDQVLGQALRRVDLAELHRDSRFQQLVDSRQIK